MLAPGVLRVLASATTLFALALAQKFCNTATVGDFGKPITETITLRLDVIPNQPVIQIKDLNCPIGEHLPPVGMRVTACDTDTYPQVFLRGLSGEVHRFGDLLKKATITAAMSCDSSSDSDDVEYSI